jgi:hypothetical protein
VVISPIDIDATTISQLKEIGQVSHIIAPNCFHYLFAAKFKEIYPEATFWAAPGLAEKKPKLPIDRNITKDAKSFIDGIEYLFMDEFKTIVNNGFSPLNECVFFHIQSRSLILTDLAFNFDESFPFTTQLAMRTIGGWKTLSPSLIEKLATTNKQKVRQAIAQILNWDFDRVIIAHGSIIETNGKERFKAGFARF